MTAVCRRTAPAACGHTSYHTENKNCAGPPVAARPIGTLFATRFSNCSLVGGGARDASQSRT